MQSDTTPTLQTCLDRIMVHSRELRELDLDTSDDVERALTESRRLQGTVMLLQGLLRRNNTSLPGLA
jgi:hypothetical protein